MLRTLHHLHPRWVACLAAAAIAAPLGLRALPTTSVVMQNLVSGEESPAAALRDYDGESLLTAGTAANGDGAIVALGYFSAPITSSRFSGTWVPLTGPASANTQWRTTSIGDTDSAVAGPYGFINTQVDFDLANAASAQSLPSEGTRLAVAIYNDTSLATATRFTIATNDAWIWKAPALLPDPVSINLNDVGTAWFDGTPSARTTSVPIAQFPSAAAPARLVNISTRGYVGTDAAVMIPGFILSGSGTKRVLVRAVGPSLDAFGIEAPLADPVLRLVRQQDGLEIAANDNWSNQPDAAAVAAAMAQAWAFGLPEDSLDAALVAELEVTPSGTGYTPQVSGATGGTGVVIAEVYMLDDGNTDARAVNISTRGHVGTGAEIMIPGFVIGPGSSRRLLIRAASGILRSLGMADTLENPEIRVFQSGIASPVATNDDWEDSGQGATIAAATSQIGVFALESGSHDAAIILDTPGDRSYTVQVSGVGGTTGIVITEVYELP